MQKKILASILVTPLAFNAMADINLGLLEDYNAWQESGISGDAPVFSGDKGNYEATSVIGIGTFSQTIKNLPKGKYRISLQNTENAQVSVKIGAQEVKPGTDSFEFSVAVNSADVTITISAIDQSKTYSFANPQLDLVYDFDAQKALLEQQLAEVTLLDVTADDHSAAAEQLRKDKAALEARIADITADIDRLADGSLEVYKEFNLFNNPNDIAAAIAALAADADKYNAAVEAENALFKTIQLNTEAMNGLLGGVTDLRDALTAVEEKIAATNNDYVKDQCNPDAATIKGEIDAYENAIKAAYADLTKNNISFDSAQHGVISTEISDLSQKVDQALADWNAYQNFQTIKNRLINVFDQASTLIAELQGIEGFSEIYNELIAEWQTSINDTYNTTMDGFGIKQDAIEGAAALAPTDIANAQAAIDAINDVLLAARDLVQTQNDAMNAANEAYADVETRFNTFLHKLVPAQYAAEYQQKIADIREALAAVRATIDDEYAKHDLTAEDYENALAEINAQIDDLEEFLTHTTPLITLAQDLAALKVYILEESKKADLKDADGNSVVNIYDKFQGTFESLQGAIDDLTLESTTDEIKEVADAIAAEKDNALKIIKAFEAANIGIKAFATDLAGLQKVVDEKTIIDGNTYQKSTFLNGTFKALSDQLTDFKADLTAAAALNAQKCYEAAKALADALAQYDADSKVDAATAEFEKDATEANYKVAEDLLADVKADWNDGEYFFKETVDFTAVDSKLAEIDGDLDTAENTTPTPVADFTAIDEALQELISDINSIQQEIDSLKANDKAYNDLIDMMPDLGQALRDLIDYNNATSLTPAKEFYDNLIQGSENPNSLAAQINAIQEKIEKALNDKKAVELFDSIKGEIEAMHQTIDQTKEAITANEAAHNSQLASSDRVRQTINGIIETIENAAAESGAPAELVADWLADLNNLLEEGIEGVPGLVPVDRDVTQAYGKGQSKENNDTFQAAYKAIEDAANSILSDFDNQYGDRIADTNATTTDSWSGEVSDMNKAYRDAINTYNDFTYGLHNEGYRQAILPVVKTHEGIYRYSQQITEVTDNFAKWLAAQNAAKHVITEAEYQAKVLEAQQLIDEINAKVALMISDVNAAAVAYYNSLHGECADAIADAQTTLADAGVTAAIIERALANAKGYLETAEALYNKAVADDVKNIIMPMDAVADQLDKVQPAIDVNAAALSQWTASYGDASDLLADLMEELESYKAADKAVKDANRAALNACIAEATALNNTATADKSLIDNLKQDLDQLQDILDRARNLVDEVKASDAANVAEQEANQNYNDVVIPGLNDDYDALVAYVNSLAGADDVDLEAVKNAIDNVADLVKRYEGQLVANKDVIDAAVETAKSQIENGYGQAFRYEKQALQEQLSKTKVAFNDAKVYGNLDAETLQGYNDSIDALESDIDNLPLFGPDADKEEFRTQALAIEKELSDIYVALMSSYELTEDDQVVSGGNPVPGILEALNNQYNTVAEAIAAGKAALDAASDEAKGEMGDKVAEYTSQLEALGQALDAQKSAWEEDGNVIVMSHGKYADNMDDILSQAEKLGQEITGAVQAAQDEADRKAASDARYDVLNDELQGYRDSLEAVRATAEQFGNLDLYESVLDNIERMIDAAQADLDSRKAAYGLTADSELINKSDITGQLAWATANIHYQYTGTEIAKAHDALDAAAEALKGNIVPSVKAELTAQLAALNDRYQTLNDSYTGTTTFNPADLQPLLDTLEGFRNEAAAIAEAANAMVTTADENRFTPGDVNLEPDGVVNVADVQMVINWIGEGVTYAELAEVSPRQAAAADINGDKELNIADVTAIIALAMDDDAATASKAPRLAIAKGVRQSSNTLGMTLVGEQGGVRTYALSLNNTDMLVGGQLDLTLPNGVELVSATLTERAAGHDLYRFDNSNGARLVIASLANAEISGNDGALVIIEVKGHGVVEADNAIFADTRSTAFKVGKADTTMIESIANGMHNMKERVYNVAGQIMRSAQRGINIIRHSDGSTTKEMH